MALFCLFVNLGVILKSATLLNFLFSNFKSLAPNFFLHNLRVPTLYPCPNVQLPYLITIRLSITGRGYIIIGSATYSSYPFSYSLQLKPYRNPCLSQTSAQGMLDIALMNSFLFFSAPTIIPYPTRYISCLKYIYLSRIQILSQNIF